MKLVTVNSATKTATEGLLELSITADLEDGAGEQVLPFGFTPGDQHGLSPAVQAWLDAHPDFPVADYVPPPVIPDQVWTEKDRRWALGFNYDFGDARGVHRIGTTPKDLEDWSKVSQLAQAAINIGQPNTSIAIVTDTGPTSVTATEWQSVILATAQFQQPIFAAALTLVQTNPIPADYADDSHWPAHA